MITKLLKSITTLSLAVSCVAISNTTQAAAIASDAASDSVYNDGWQAGDNGGSGFNPWDLQVYGPGSFVIESSATNGGSTTIDTAGRAFGINNESGALVAVRTLTVGGSNSSDTLAVGQAFKFTLDAGNNTGEYSLALYDGTNNEERLRIHSNNSFGNFRVRINGGAYQDTGVARTQDGLTVELLQQAANGYTLKLGANTFTEANFGAFGDSDINTFVVVAASTGTSGSETSYINNLEVVPEPSAVLLLGLAGVASWFVARRRRN